jgi:hypothetical protein
MELFRGEQLHFHRYRSAGRAGSRSVFSLRRAYERFELLRIFDNRLEVGSSAVIRVYDEADNVIETHEHAGNFKEP